MYFYRPLQPFYAITVDLDNTLYNNNPIINKAEEKSTSLLQAFHPILQKIQKKDYLLSRIIEKKKNPEIYHNANNWRWKSLQSILLHAGLNKHEAGFGADQAMEAILHWRNKIQLSRDTHNTLSALNTKWPLIAITNGNANLPNYEIKKYFYAILRSGVHGRAKPFPDMYYLAAKKIGVPCKNILHIGDDLKTDIQGSIQAGMQSCWIKQHKSLYYKKTPNILSLLLLEKKLFPHCEISNITSLTKLI